MKKLIFTILLSAFAISGSAQKLLDIYKKGPVHLVPDTEYAKDNNWDIVFKTYNDTIYGQPMGNRKSLILLPDGSAVVNHRYRDNYSKFSANGKFEMEFGIKNSTGEKIKKFYNIDGIINNNTFFTSLDNMGKMVLLDFNGNLKRTLKLDYMTRQMIPLPNNKIAVVGWVIWSNKFRDFISIVDYETNQEKVIWEHYTNRSGMTENRQLFNYGYTFSPRKGKSSGGSFSFTTMPYSDNTGMNKPPVIACSDNKIVVAIPSTGEILVYDLEGNLKSKDNITWEKKYVSVEEQKAIQQKVIERYKNIKNDQFASWISPEENKLAIETVVKQMEADLEKISKPILIPTFSTVIKDSDGNLLFFEFPKEEKANKFNVWIYENSGKFVCQSSFVCDDYNLEINPAKLVFHKGYIYGIQILKKATGVPMRLVRFKIQ